MARNFAKSRNFKKSFLHDQKGQVGQTKSFWHRLKFHMVGLNIFLSKNAKLMAKLNFFSFYSSTEDAEVLATSP